MNKAELIAAMAAKTGETKKAAEASVNAFVEVVTESLKKGEKGDYSQGKSLLTLIEQPRGQI